MPLKNRPIRYDRGARKGDTSPRLLLIFVPAPRSAFNLSGIYPMPPLGIAYLAAYLRKHDFFGTALLDVPAFDIPPEDMLSVLQNDSFDVYGLSATLPGLGEVAKISHMIKHKVNPDAVVVLGGPATGLNPGVLFDHLPDIDLIVQGPGEEPLLEIVKNVGAKESLNDIPGAFIRKDDHNMKIETGVSLSEYDYSGPPARDLLPMKRYKLHPPFGLFPPGTTVETIRGCHYGCNFCCIPNQVTFRTVQDVMDELETLAGWGYKEVYFIDPTFPIDRDRTVNLCQTMIKANLGLKWACKSRVDTLDSELLNLMARAGCYMISLGVESGSNGILTALGKQTTVESTRKTLRECSEARIRVLSYIIIGSPGETDKTVRETVQLLIKERVAFSLFGELFPDPGTAMFFMNGEKKREAEEAFVQYFIQDNTSQELLPGLDVGGISKEQRRKWLRWANRTFYLRPGYIYQRIVDLRSLREIYILANGLFHFVREARRVMRIA